MSLLNMFRKNGGNGNNHDKINKALRKAVLKLKPEKVREALEKGAHPGQIDGNGNTLLHFSAYKGHYEISKMLVGAAKEKNAEILNHVNEEGKTPMDMVMDSNENRDHTKVLVFLRLNKAVWRSPIIYLESGIDGAVESVITTNLSSELIESAVNLDIEYAKKLLRNGADMNPNMTFNMPTSPLATLMSIAINEGLTPDMKKMAEFLVNNNAKVDGEFGISPEHPQFGKTNLMLMAKNVNIPEDVVDLIRALYHKQLVTEDFTKAAKEGDVELGMQALNRGASVNVRFDTYETALHQSLAAGHGDFIRMLLQEHPEIDVKDNQGGTLLHVAPISGDIDMLNLVREAYEMAGLEFDVNVRDDLGNTPLHMAIRPENYDMVQALHIMGADLDVENNRGISPLAISTDIDDAKMVSLLVGLEAKITDEVLMFTKQIGAIETYEALKEWRRTGEKPEVERRPEVEKVEGTVIHVKFGNGNKEQIEK